MPDPTAKVTPAPHAAWPNDHGVWLMCFTAAINGHVARRGKTLEEVPPKTIAERCARIADAALKEEQKRRPEAV